MSPLQSLRQAAPALAIVLLTHLPLHAQTTPAEDTHKDHQGMNMPMSPKSQHTHDMDDMQGMKMGTGMYMGGPSNTLRESVLRHMDSGTSLDPASTAPPMIMQMHGNWMLMLHGHAMIVEQQQSGPRGADKFFSTNWIMPMAQRNYAHGQLTLRTMLSLEPATISGRYFPELFQQGEIAFGKPIIDGQHPHNFFMEIAALYDVKLGKQSLFTLYAAPVGDPAMGPVAFPHRASASDNPLAPLGHHLEDSTHIADDVLTGGLTVHKLRIEASGFHGREPDENRWHIQVGAINSWSTRLTVAPTRDWAAQYSVAHLTSPEALHAEENVLRQTASIAYHHTWKADSTNPNTLDALALWGSNHAIASSTNSNGYLFEATARLQQKHSLWTRIENVDRTSDLLGAEAPHEEAVIGRVQAFTAGYAHRLYNNNWSRAFLGAQGTLYNTPEPLRPLYGDHPKGIAIILKFQLGKLQFTK